MLPPAFGAFVFGLPVPGVMVPSELLDEPVVRFGAASLAVRGFSMVPPDFALGGLPEPPPTCALAAVIERARAHALAMTSFFMVRLLLDFIEQLANARSPDLFLRIPPVVAEQTCALTWRTRLTAC